MNPTQEQQTAIDLFSTGDDLVINAGAGTGKTSTLELIGRSTGQRGRYLAFNKGIVTDAQRRMPGNVKASTVHSLAFADCGKPMAHRLNSARMPGWRTAKLLGVDPVKVDTGAGQKLLQPGWLAGHVMRAVTQFCQSADPEPTVRHFPYLDGLDPLVDGKRTFKNNNDVAKYLLPALRRAWRDLTDPDGQLRYQHDCYLKSFALEGRRVGADFILHDEAQDANPVTLQILAAQTDTQVVHVGDSQQAIYGWRGSVDAMARALDAGAAGCWLTQSFRFGPTIASLANDVLTVAGAGMRLVGLDTIPSTIGPVGSPDVVLCRTNAAAVEQCLTALEAGRRPHLVGGSGEIARFAEAAAQLQAGEETWHPELACFPTWGAVQDFVAQDIQGDELKMLVDLVDTYTPQVIIDALGNMPSERSADLIVSTAHKSKGRQWPTVALCEDFDRYSLHGDDEVPPEELRLLYMAVTRAERRLDPSAAVGVFHKIGVTLPDDEGVVL